MSAARAPVFAWGLAALALALLILAHVAAFATGTYEYESSDLFTSVLGTAFAAVGALVASRHERNAIGWIFLGAAVSVGIGGLAHSFVDYRLDNGEAGTLTGVAATYSDASWVPFMLVPATFLLLLFPDGRLPSHRWRFVAWCAAAGIVGVLITSLATPKPLADFPTVANPLAIDSPLLEPLEGLSFLALLIGVFGSAASLVVRFRRAERLQRQQIKWLAAAGAVVAVTLAAFIPLYDTVGESVANGAMMGAVLCLPVAAGIAILRHRLYDIDVVINRALVYGALTAILAGAYLGSVLLLQLVLSGVTQNNGLAIAASTLAVAGLFRPARGRIQATVDRRFYRRKYDASRTLAEFGAHLRDEVDLDALGAELRAVVGETMQPAHVTLWLRTPGGSR